MSIVKKILNDCTRKGKVYYEIDWEEQGSTSSFEAYENLTDCEDILQAYLHSKKKKNVSFIVFKIVILCM